MQSAPADALRPHPSRTWSERFFGRWWRRQSAARQDRFATLGPLVSVLLFLAAIISAFWYLRNEEFEREQESVKRDTEISQQQIRLRLLENQEQLVRIAGEVVGHVINRDEFLEQAAGFTREHPEVTTLLWVNSSGASRVYVPGANQHPDSADGGDAAPASLPAANPLSEPATAFAAARNRRQPVYSKPFADAFGNAVFQVHVPLIERGAFIGTLIACRFEISSETKCRITVSTEYSAIKVPMKAPRSISGTWTWNTALPKASAKGLE